MGSKYRQYQMDKGPSVEEMRRIHPVWRGVGCVLMVLMPIIAWAAADELITNRIIPLPSDMLAGPGDFLYGIIPDTLIHIRLALFVVILLVLYALLTFLTFLMNRFFGITPRSDPFYVPPVRPRRQRRY